MEVEYRLPYTAEEIEKKLGEVPSWNNLEDRPIQDKYISTSDEKNVPASSSVQIATIVPPIGYTENKRRKIHPNAVVDVYFDGVLFVSICGANGTFESGTNIVYMSDETYGDLTYNTKVDRRTTLFALEINLPPLAHDTVVRATYRYPSGVEFVENYIPDAIARVSDVEEMISENRCTCDEADPIIALTECEIIDPVADENNAIYVDENGNIFSL